jgi:hypothetical protein
MAVSSRTCCTCVSPLDQRLVFDRAAGANRAADCRRLERFDASIERRFPAGFKAFSRLQLTEDRCILGALHQHQEEVTRIGLVDEN